MSAEDRHAELKLAHEAGAEIQRLRKGGRPHRDRDWTDEHDPAWWPVSTYRIKPAPVDHPEPREPGPSQEFLEELSRLSNQERLHSEQECETVKAAFFVLARLRDEMSA